MSNSTESAALGVAQRLASAEVDAVRFAHQWPMAFFQSQRSDMKFSDLAARLTDVQAAPAAHALTEIQEKYLFDISGAEFSGGGTTTGGSGQPPQFNAFAQWSMSF